MDEPKMPDHINTRMSEREDSVIRDQLLESVLKQIHNDIANEDYKRALFGIVDVLQTELNTKHRNIFEETH